MNIHSDFTRKDGFKSTGHLKSDVLDHKIEIPEPVPFLKVPQMRELKALDDLDSEWMQAPEVKLFELEEIEVIYHYKER